jgi:iron complex outermembrane receptor protein
VFLKTSYELDTNQSVGLTYIFYQTEQNSNLKTLPGVVGESKSTVFSGEQEGLFPATINHNLSASYFRQNIWKETNFSFVTFYQNIKARFNYSDFFQGQSFIQSQKYGTRADFVSYLHSKLRVHYGVDFLSDQTEQGLEDGRVWMPLITQYSVAPFTQVKYDLTKKLLLKGGLRYEIASLNIPTFEGIQTKGIVEGGTINYQTPLVNTSVLYKLHKYLKPSVSFSQGFSLADIGRVVRALDAPSIADLSLSAMVVNNYEVGLQGKFKYWEYFCSAYISTSALGSSYESYPDIKVTRAPEQIYGTEASVNIQFLPKWTLKYSISYLEGKVDTDDNGSYDAYLNGTRIPPLTMNTALRFSPSKHLYAQIQTLYVGSRDRFDNSTQAYEGKVVAYNTTDLLVGTKLWKGNLSMAINNVFNQFYFPSISQWVNTGEGYTAGVGINFSVTYQYNLSQKK